MKSRCILVGLLCVSLGALGTALWRLGLRAGERNSRQALVSQGLRGSPSKRTPGPAAITFNWRQVESADYRDYIANLRSIGCPEETIRDIVIADITKLFAERKRALLNPGPWQYWRPASGGISQLARERQQQIESLDNERRLLLSALLGPEAEADLARAEASDQWDRLEFLPPEKRVELLRLEASFKAQRQALYKQSEESNSAPDWQQLRALLAQREGALSAMLSPSQLFEYQLRTDEIAERLRRSLVGFELTEPEFRELFRMQKAHEAQFSFIDPSDTPAIEQETADRLSTEEQIKAVLGEVRYSQYRRGSDSHFRDLYRLTQQFDLPPDTAGTLYERHYQMQNEITRIQTDPNIAPETRDQAVRGFQSTMDALLRQTLGAEAYQRLQAGGIDRFLGN